MNAIYGISLFIFCLSVQAAAAAESRPDPAQTPFVTPAAERAATFRFGDALGDLSWRFLGELGGQAPLNNLAVSPWGLAQTLGMLHTGARGVTRSEIASVLGGHRAELGQSFASARAQLAGMHQVEFSGSNALWLANRFTPTAAYQAALERDFGAGVGRVEFARAEDAAREINAWLEKQTQGQIKQLLSAQALQGDVRAVLTNAAFFKGAWAQPFDVRRTKPAPFVLANGEVRQVSTLSTRLALMAGLLADGTLAAVLPFAAPELEMVLLMPRTADLPTYVRGLRAQTLNAALDVLPTREQELFLPRFSVESPILPLKAVLARMGMHTAFSNSADFGDMASPPDIKLAEVLHKARVDVTEEGATASAATAAIMLGKGLSLPSPKIVFDRPFVFMIRHRGTGIVLFAGWLAAPEAVPPNHPTSQPHLF